MPAPVQVPPPSPTPVPSQPADWQITSVEEFIDLIPELPNGFPQPLWGIPQEKVAAEVLATSMLYSDGRPICYVGGKAYHADKKDLATFMQPFE